MKNELLFFKEKFISGEGIPKGRDLLFSAGYQISKKSRAQVRINLQKKEFRLMARDCV